MIEYSASDITDYRLKFLFFSNYTGSMDAMENTRPIPARVHYTRQQDQLPRS